MPADISISGIEVFETALKKYQKKKIIGQGGSGFVFSVVDETQNEYAIKCLKPDHITQERIDRFKNELFFSIRNTHPNILSVIDYGFIRISDVKTPFFVMPLYPSTLRKEMTRAPNVERQFELFLKILDGLEEAHRRSITHRDIKPENILINNEKSSLVIADFGIAHFSEEDLYTKVETTKSTRLANFQYAAPEQKNRGIDADQRADILCSWIRY